MVSTTKRNVAMCVQASPNPAIQSQWAVQRVPVFSAMVQGWKVSEQCGIAASKGNQILGLIRRNITYKEKQLTVPLYKAIVRPHLEYCIQAWRPYRKKDIDKTLLMRADYYNVV